MYTCDFMFSFFVFEIFHGRGFLVDAMDEFIALDLVGEAPQSPCLFAGARAERFQTEMVEVQKGR